MDHRFPPPSNEIDFERFAVDFYRAYWTGSNPQRWGRRGQRQDGIDIIDMNAAVPLRAAQCKWKSSGNLITAEEIESDVAAARNFDLGGLRIGRYSVITTSARDTAAQAVVVRLNAEHRRQDLFAIELLTWEEVEEILRQHPGLYEQSVGRLLQTFTEPIREKLATTHVAVLTLSQKVDELVVRTGSDGANDQLELAKRQLDAHEPQSAALILAALRERHWNEMSVAQRFLTCTYLGRSALMLGQWAEAARHWIEAKVHAPTEERALVNEARALELLGHTEEAHVAARAIAQQFEATVRAWTVICRTAPSSVDWRDLQAEVPIHARTEGELLVALAVRALEQGDLPAAQRLSFEATTSEPNWAAPWVVLGQARLQSAISNVYKTPDLIRGADTALLTAACEAFSTGRTVAERSHDTYQGTQALLGSGRAKRILGDLPGADADLRNAYRRSPHDGQAALAFGLFLIERDQHAAAIPVLQDAIELGCSSEARFPLGMAIRDQGGSEPKPEWLRHLREAAADTSCATQIDAFYLVLMTLIADGRQVDTEVWLTSIQAALPPPIIAAAHALIANSRGIRSEAVSEYHRAAANWDSALPLGARRFLAMVGNHLGEFRTSLPIWEHVLHESHELSDAWATVNTARRVGRHDTMRKIGEDWRRAGIFDLHLFDAELAVLEEYEPLAAAQLLLARLEEQPNDGLSRLRLSILGGRLDRSGWISADPAQYPPASEIEPRLGKAVVGVLGRAGNVLGALDYSYSLLRHNPRAPDAHAAFAWHILRHEKELKELCKPPRAVGIDSAVRYREQGNSQERWFVIEKGDDSARLEDEFRPEHPLAQAAMGKAPGDTFLIAGDELDGRKAEITGLGSKFSYRTSVVMQQWQITFPDHPGFEQFHVAGADNPQVIPDLTGLIRRLHQDKRQVDHVLDLYRNHPVTLHVVADRLGRPLIDTVEYLALRADFHIRCGGDAATAISDGAAAVRSSGTHILDLSALATLRLLRLVHVLKSWPARLLMSASTWEELISWRNRRVEFGGEHQVVASNSDLGLQFTEHSREEIAADHADTEDFLQLVRTHVAIVDCGLLADVDPDKREKVVALCGEHGAESAILGAQPDSLLWTDDGVAAFVAREFFETKSAWTQILLDYLLTRGVISPEEFFDASARLLGWEYKPTWLDLNVLRAAGEIAEWNSSSWPLKQGMDVASADNNLPLAAAWFCSLLTSPLLHSRHEQVALSLLDRIERGTHGIAGVLALRRTLPMTFGLNASDGLRASRLIDGWLRIRGLTD